MNARWLTIGCLVVSLFAMCLPGGSPAKAADAEGSTALSRPPLSFIENRGQVDARARYYLPGAERDIWLAEDAIWVTLHQPDETAPTPHPLSKPADSSAATLSQHLKISFPGANPHPRLEPVELLETHVSYFIGADPTKWHTDIPVWGGVRYVELYPGVDLEVSGRSGAWQWRVRTAPGAGLGAVRMQVQGADGLAPSGDRLQVTTRLGEFSLPLFMVEDGPFAVDVARVTDDQVLWPFALAEGAGTATLPVADQPDDLLYSTYLGGGDWDEGYGIAVDSAGSAYVTGMTKSDDFPIVSAPGYDTNHDGVEDAFVVKLNPAGTDLAYATFLGGSAVDAGYGIAVDDSGNAYVTGWSNSSDFPTTPGAFDSSCDGLDVFVAKLNPTGSGLVYGTCLGGSEGDAADDIAVDGAGSAYVSGWTRSSDFPTTPGAFDTTFAGADLYPSDGFAVKMNPAGSEMDYGTFVGGSSNEGFGCGGGIAVDGAGSAYVTGNTWSDDFPTTPGAFDTRYNGFRDAFVVELNPAGSELVYGSFLGGTVDDEAHGIVVDAAGSAYVTGDTSSDDFPTTPSAFDPSFDFQDAFVVKLNPAGNALTYGTSLGGTLGAGANGIAIDATGAVYVTGSTLSTDFPTPPGAFDTSHNGGTRDAFVARLNPTGSGLDYGTYLGGSADEYGNGIATDGAGNAYVVGRLRSLDFPITPGAFDTEISGTWEAFVAKLATGEAAATYSISGRVTDGSGIGVQGVTISASGGATATTIATGAYTVTGLITGTYILTPTKSGYTFAPLTRTVSVPPSRTGHDFTAWAPAAITFDLPLQANIEGISPEQAFSAAFNRCTTSFFDHRYPLESPGDGLLWMFTGISLTGSLTDCELLETCYDSHEGYDFHNMPACGNGVYAAAAGQVISAETGWGNDGYGYRVVIRHGTTGYKTLYGHLAEILVSSGAVAEGTRIGTIGNSGCAGCGTHLHFNTYYNGVLVDPSSWFGSTADPWEQRSGVESLYLWPYMLSRSGRTYGATGGSITSASGNVQVSVPAGASSDTLDFVIMDAPVANPSATLSPTGYSFFLQARDSLGNLVRTFSKPLEIVISFSRAALKGVKLDTLSLYVWNESSREWEVLDTDLDLENETATSQTNHLSYFALMGQPVREVYLPVIRR